MDIFLDCLPCFLTQALDASRMATDRAELHEKILREAISLASQYSKFRYPPELGRDLHQAIKKITGVYDPYEGIKKENIEVALKIYPHLKQFLFGKMERLYWALKVSATGNNIDSAIYKDIDIEDFVQKELEKEFSVCDIEQLMSRLKNAKKLLIIGDNAGETVFDLVLAEELINLDITYAVRSEPIINDATIEDAYASGLGSCTRVISSGCNAPGLIIEECSDEFMFEFNNADIVISKGQGNYECLSDFKGREIFFLLKAKCPVASNMLGVDFNDYVFKMNVTIIGPYNKEKNK